MADILDYLTAPDEITAGERAQAMQAALRRQQAAGVMGVASGDAVLSKLGGELMQDAGTQQKALAGMPGERLKLALEQAQATKRQRLDAAARDPASLSSQVSQGLAAEWMPQLKDRFANAPAESLDTSLPLMERYAQAKQMAEARRAAMGAMGAGGAMLSPQAIDQAAEFYATTGQVPHLAMGKAGAQAMAQIANRAAKLHPETNLAESKAGFHADQASLGHLQQMADASEAFERTAGRNLDVAMAAAQQIPDLGSTWLNRSARALAAGSGNEKVAAFKTALETARSEVAKVLSSPTGAGVLSDAARHDAQTLLSDDATVGQMMASMKVLRSDMANRRQTYRAAVQEIRSRAGGKAPAPEPAMPATAQRGAIRRTDPATGETRSWNGSAWVKE